MKISVIIPVYKVEAYVRRCLESVSQQSCEGFQIECIVVDDCSPDNSMDIAESVIRENRNQSVEFVVLHHDQNKGLCEARNTGIRAATGDYLFFIDSDDCIMENTFRDFMRYALSHPDVDVFMGSSLCVGVNTLTNEKITGTAAAQVILSDKHQMWQLLLRRRLDHHVWNKLIKRSVGVENLFFEPGIIYEDIPWTYKLLTQITSILVLPEQTYIYELNPDSIIHTIENRSASVISSFAFICNYVLENPPAVNHKRVLFVAHQLFLLHWMLFALDVRRKYGADTSTDRRLSSVRRRMMAAAVGHGRLLLALFMLTMFSPFNRLLRLRLFRSNVDRINKMVYKLSW